MRTRKGLALHKVCGTTILIAEGIENIDFSNVISMNETSIFLWQNVQDKDFTEEDLAKLLIENYEIDYDTALQDSKDLIEKWIESDIILK